jgi:hypothetical protein
MKEKRYLAAAHVSVSGLESVNKAGHLFVELITTMQSLEQHKSQAGLQWPTIDQGATEQRLRSLNRQFALVLAESAARAPLVALGGGVFPDYLGQAFNVCFDIALDALLEGDKNVFDECATWLFVLGAMADERLRPKSATPYELSVATLPLTMLMELSAYALVLSPAHGKGFGNTVHRLWDKHTELYPNPASACERLAAILSYRRAQLVTLMHGDVQRTGRELRIEQLLRHKGWIKDPYERSRRGGRPDASEQEVPALIRALDQTLSFHYMVDVFAAIYLLGHGVDPKKVPREARELAARLHREMGFVTQDDEGDDDESP